MASSVSAADDPGCVCTTKTHSGHRPDRNPASQQMDLHQWNEVALLRLAERSPSVLSLKQASKEATMHKLSVILIISMIFVLAAPCTALAGGKVEQTYKPQKEDGTTSATKRISNPSTGSAIKSRARR